VAGLRRESGSPPVPASCPADLDLIVRADVEAGVSDQPRCAAIDYRPDAEPLLALMGDVVPQHGLSGDEIRRDSVAHLAHHLMVAVNPVGGLGSSNRNGRSSTRDPTIGKRTRQP
jgi:hypothetical protein